MENMEICRTSLAGFAVNVITAGYHGQVHGDGDSDVDEESAGCDHHI
jgi:hypothetical protein